MQLLNLRLKNWGPYFGEHSVALSVTSGAPVVIVRGENMRGKTSLLRAIVWCLYGRIFQQDGKTPLDVAELVNRDALASGDSDFEVALEFSHEGRTFEMVRSGVGYYESDELPATRSLRTTLKPSDGNPIAEQQIPDEIERILSPQISDFFFFDGEMLIRFEERLREDRDSSKRFVREQVERALGLPFLKALGGDLEALGNDLSAELQKATRSNARAQTLKAGLDEVEAVLEVKERDEEALQRAGIGLDVVIKALEEQMSAIDEIRAIYMERDSLNREAQTDERDAGDVERQLRELAEQKWWFPLANALSASFSAATDDLASASSRTAERVRTEYRLSQLTRELETAVCESCGQPLPEHTTEGMRIEAERLASEMASLEPAGDVDQIRDRLTNLKPFAIDSNLGARIEDLEQDLRRFRIRVQKKKVRMAEIDEALAGNRVDIRDLDLQLRTRREERAEVSRNLSQIERDVTVLKANRANVRAQIAKLPEVAKVDRERMEVYAEALEVVNSSFDTFRRSMRAQVEARSTEIFKQLTTEKEFEGVRLNDDYTLAVLDQDNSPLRVISAGANQILTMSFIGALAKSSVAEAPMVMDTPLGRLDKGHRKSILNWVSQMDSQVILFVQSGEYDPSTDTELLNGRIGRELVIERIDANSSRIVAA